MYGLGGQYVFALFFWVRYKNIGTNKMLINLTLCVPKTLSPRKEKCQIM